MTAPAAPAPIIRAPRIPLELQRVFLASNRGETVNVPPQNALAFQVFPRNKSKSMGMRKVKSCELFSLLCDSSSSEHEDLSDDEGRVRPRRARRMLKFADGEAMFEFDQRKPTTTIQCHNSSKDVLQPAKQRDVSPVSPVRTMDVPEVSKPALPLPNILESRWRLTCHEKLSFDSSPSLPMRKSTRRRSTDCAPSFPVRQKSGGGNPHAFPRRSSIDSVPRLPRRSGVETCMAL